MLDLRSNQPNLKSEAMIIQRPQYKTDTVMLLTHFLHLIDKKVIYKRWLRGEIAQKCLEILLLLNN